MFIISRHTGRIGGIETEYPIVVEAGREATLSMHLYNTGREATLSMHLYNTEYNESVTLTITSIGEPKMIYFNSAPNKILSHLLFDIVDQYIVHIVADNEVSKITEDIIINVVGKK